MTPMATRLEVKDGNGTVCPPTPGTPSGRMIGASTGGNTVSYTYDDAGNRTSETVNGQTTKFLNDPNQAYDQVLEEYAPRRGAGGDVYSWCRSAFRRIGAVRFRTMSSDNLGSTRALTNSRGR